MGRNGADSGKYGRAHEDNISAKNGRCGKVAQLPFIRLLGWSVAPIWRDNVQQSGKSSLGALLRERKVTGRDASRDSVGRFVILCPRVYRFSRVFIPFNRPCPLTSVKK